MKNIQGSNRHIGRNSKFVDKENDEYNINKEKVEKDNEENDKLKKLNEDLKQAIKEERYEEAAKIRDEIKSMNKE